MRGSGWRIWSRANGSAPASASLKVGFNKVFGYYIEVTRANSHLVPDDYIRKQTLTNAERYITPELKEYETLILNAEERILEIERRVFTEVMPAGGNMRPGCWRRPISWPNSTWRRRWRRRRRTMHVRPALLTNDFA
jgi:hypothetical protein